MEERASGMEGNREVEDDNEQEEEKWRIWDKRGNFFVTSGGQNREEEKWFLSREFGWFSAVGRG
jgi:RPA family protein